MAELSITATEKKMEMKLETETTEQEAVLTKPQEAASLASGYFKQGLNCTECVLKAIMDLNETGLSEAALCLATGFGAGMGDTKNTCGAITGAVMALGALKGRKNPFELETPRERAVQLNQELYPAFGALVKEIEAHYGTLICRELTAPMGDFEGKARRKSCMQIIGHCAEMAQKHIEL